MWKIKAAVLTLLLAAITACSADVNQDMLCQVRDWRVSEVAKVCKEGQKIAYFPNSFGNAQLPILFTAGNCDHRYSIALTEGAVSCIYKKVKKVKDNESEFQPG